MRYQILNLESYLRKWVKKSATPSFRGRGSGAESESVLAVEVIGDLGVIREHQNLMMVFPGARLKEERESGRTDENRRQSERRGADADAIADNQAADSLAYDSDSLLLG